MTPRRQALLWAALPLLLLAPPQWWLGLRLADQLDLEERARARVMLESQARSLQRSLDRLEGKLDSLAVFAAERTADGRAMDPASFQTFASGLHAGSDWIRAYQLVEDGVIRHVYPLKGNEVAQGYNLLTAPLSVHGTDIDRALQTGRTTLTGPLELIQGGIGIVLRKPVGKGRDGPARLAGVVLNLQPLLAESGISEPLMHGLRLAIRRSSGEVFFGAPAVFAQQPVLSRVSLPEGYWELAAVPAPGWRASSDRLVLWFELFGNLFVVVLCGLFYALARSRTLLEETVRQRTAALRAGEQQYRELVEHANSIILRWDAAGRITFLNEYGQRFFGYAPSEIRGRHVLETIVPPTESSGRDLQQLMDQILSDPAAFERNTNENVRRNGERVWVAWTNRIVRDAQGAIAEILSVGTDVTEQRRAEAALRESEERYRRTLDNSLESFQLIGFDWRYLYLNHAAAVQNRRPNSELLGRTMPEAWPGIEASEVFGLLRRCMEQRQAFHEEKEFHFADGSSGWFDVRVQPVPEGIFVLSIDISERKQAEHELRLLNESLEHKIAERTRDLSEATERARSADRLKSAFLATMSHELRTPLNSIIGFTGIILLELAGPLNEEQKKQLGMVQVSARRLLELINDVLDISRIEAGEMRMAAEPFDLAASARKVVAMIEPLAEKKGLALVARVADNLPALTGDARRVEQILLNLLGNAVKFTEAGTVTLTVEAAADDRVKGPAVRLRVADTGIGIKPEDMSWLFQPFRQVDSALSRTHDGTGLGLAICRRLATLMGGVIDAESIWEQGSVFTVTLPEHPPGEENAP
ncbi:PAS domain S-box-containing protein [Fluviicoccus keumensis]|uniref:histidine kinase n=1 Tax=Fluviicoccus keumensis TaxID=1435465 RepID=A0A4Q7YPR4_9GAMM|nr:PAS domain S-box protein [Fluviicoccus keumensis]RZU38729.1 PAS domain S-box-containing protein [Fluviicoccus keumensis]